MKRLTLAKLVMSGQMTRQEALLKLEEPDKECPEHIMNLFLRNINLTREEFDKYVDMGPRHLQYHPQPKLINRLIRKAFKIQDPGRL